VKVNSNKRSENKVKVKQVKIQLNETKKIILTNKKYKNKNNKKNLQLNFQNKKSL